MRSGELKQWNVTDKLVALSAIRRIALEQRAQRQHALHVLVEHGLVTEVKVLEHQVHAWHTLCAHHGAWRAHDPNHPPEERRFKGDDRRRSIHLSNQHERRTGRLVQRVRLRERSTESGGVQAEGEGGGGASTGSCIIWCRLGRRAHQKAR